MRFLLDNNLSPKLVPVLTDAGWNVEHLRALGLHAAPDYEVLTLAASDDRTLISADTDFGALLAASHASGPSVVLVRRIAGRRVHALAQVLIANLSPLEAELRTGSVVVIGEENVRVRRLPLT